MTQLYGVPFMRQDVVKMGFKDGEMMVSGSLRIVNGWLVTFNHVQTMVNDGWWWLVVAAMAVDGKAIVSDGRQWLRIVDGY